MNPRALVGGTAALAVAAFAGAAYVFRAQPATPTPTPDTPAPAAGLDPAVLDIAVLNRPHSPILGPVDAPVTITEFLDPSCGACRAFHPIVKQILAAFPTQVRVVMRYAAFHEGADEAVRILETARIQNLFEPVLNALLEGQPEWAPHSGPNLELAWEIAGRAGLHVATGKVDRMMPGIVAVLNIDAADVATVGVRQVPTFFVNGKPLPKFGPEEWFALVRSEVEAL